MPLPRKLTEKQLIGKRVVSDVALESGWGLKLPAGTIFIIKGAHYGLSLRSETCPRCGASLYITRVDRSQVSLLPTDDICYDDEKWNRYPEVTPPEKIKFMVETVDGIGYMAIFKDGVWLKVDDNYCCVFTVAIRKVVKFKLWK